MSFRNRRGSTPVTAEAERLNAWAASATTEELMAWDADLQGLQAELRQLRADQALNMSQQEARTRAGAGAAGGRPEASALG